MEDLYNGPSTLMVNGKQDTGFEGGDTHNTWSP